MSQAIDTSKAERRKLWFDSIDEALADVDRIVEAERAGTLRQTGNWTAGQALGHLASWVEYGYDGYPMKPLPFFICRILRWKVKQFLVEGLPGGVRIPGVGAGTYGVEVIPAEEGADRLRRAFGRLKSGERCGHESPAFGPMSHEDRIALNLRHAELHLGFLQP